MTSDFHLTESTTLLRSFVFAVERRTVRHGFETFTRDVIVHPGAVAVVAIDDQERVGVVRQYRAPFDRVTMEIPAGTLDVAGEEPLAAAQRELAEEMGRSAQTWRSLGRFMVSPGWVDQIMHVFEARDLRELPRAPAGPEETSSTTEWLDPVTLRERLRAEPAIDATMMVGLHAIYGTFFRDD